MKLPAALVLASLLVGATASAQPKPADKPDDKVDARSLMQSGLKLYTAKDYLGALAVFKDAYARFPSAKILINIGTTLKVLDRKAEAANAYQRYIDSPDAEPAKQAEIEKILTELDKSVSTLAITVAPADSQVQVNDEEWQPAAQTKRYRVAPGDVSIHARHDGYRGGETSTKVAVGEVVALQIALAVPTQSTVITTPVDNGIHAMVAPEPPRSRIGAMAMGHFDVVHPGGAGLVGVTVDVTRRFQVQAAALLGKSSGGYAGASVALLTGKVRPLLSVGMPIFASGGARYAIRGAAGVELAFSRHLSVVAEAGVEHLFNPEMSIDATEFIPAVGIVGRL